MPDTKVLHSSKTLQGVAGAPMSVLGEMDVGFTIGKSKLLHRVCVADKINFPGDLLMGMDFLRRLDMRLVTSNKFSGAYLLLGGVHFSVKYTGEESLGCVSVPSVEVAKERRATQTLRIAPVHVVHTELIGPQSGQFVSAAVARGLPESRAILDTKPRRLTQGTCIGFAEQVGVDQLVDVNVNGSVTGKDPRAKEDTVYTLLMKYTDELSTGSCKVWPADDEQDFGYSDSEYFVFPATPALSGSSPCSGDSVLPPDKAEVNVVDSDFHHIITTTNQLVCVRQWRLHQATKELIRSECDTMLKQGVIEPSTSSWVSPVVLGLNHVTAADSYPLPRTDKVIESLTGKLWYTFQQMPFGLSMAPTTFQRMMNVVLSSVLGRHMPAYLDDVVVASKTFESHLSNLTETLGLLDEAGMKLNLAKCLFAKHQIVPWFCGKP
ncbi:uncharacterized protein LOC119575949 [Penaeus monodon]|uniref:uncharacterized protein LOC119575949 n=1 Tax=Penaeus monodon TaxID=6687 RepID=UPI0018A7A23A|nr:uncharacterized protein LOC119575949 [Penaeus monodon]